MSTEFGVDLRLVKADDAEGVGMYCTKAGYEMALADSKVGRAEGNRHPFAIARDAATTGDKADIDLYREWIVSSHGRRSITWSTELREQVRARPGQAPTKSWPAEQEAGDVICNVDRELWWQIVCTRTGARARFLAHLDARTRRAGRPPSANSWPPAWPSRSNTDRESHHDWLERNQHTTNTNTERQSSERHPVDHLH